MAGEKIEKFPSEITIDDVQVVLRKAGDQIAATRPTAVNLFWAIGRMNNVSRQGYDSTQSLLQALYKEALPILHEYQRSLHPDMNERPRDRNTVEGWAKEDARYALNLATQAQLGFSANARNLEHVIRKLRHHPLAEVRMLSKRLGMPT